MKNLIPLMRREWLQHRLVWAMLVLVPLGLAVLLHSFSEVNVGNGNGNGMAGRFDVYDAPMMVQMTIVITAGVLFLVVWAMSVFVASGLARRDHGDRSIEFWLSLPTGHAESLAAPLIVHLLLVPAWALLVGLAGGYALSLLFVSSFHSFSQWLSLPWGDIVVATLVLAGRVLAGLPLATLWLSPLILLFMLAYALSKRWGRPVLAVGLLMGGEVLKYVFGKPQLRLALERLTTESATALIGASGQDPAYGLQTGLGILQATPGWAVQDFAAALSAAASPAMLGAVAVAAGLFAALVYWRRQGAGITG